MIVSAGSLDKELANLSYKKNNVVSILGIAVHESAAIVWKQPQAT